MARAGLEREVDVARVDVAVDQPERRAGDALRLVDVGEPAQEVDADLERHRRRERPAQPAQRLDERGQVAAGEVLDGEVELVVPLADLVELDEVRVAQQRHHVALGGEELGGVDGAGWRPAW